MKLKKASKARIKRMNATDRKAILKAALILADAEIITSSRYMAVHRIVKSCQGV